MRLLDHKTSTPQGGNNRQRVDLEFAHGANDHRLRVYFVVDGAAPISRLAISNAAFLIGAGFAYLNGEAYEQSVPVDPLLLRHWKCVLKEWRKWPSGQTANAISVPVESNFPKRSANEGLFFSGGVDSFFSFLKHDGEPPIAISVEHAEPGADEIDRAFVRLESLAEAADQVGFSGSIRVVTNMMLFHPVIIDRWAEQIHGAYFASVAQLLSSNIQTAIFSSSFVYGFLKPWGSHPLIDPMMSSNQVQFEHFGNAWSRLEKTEEIVANSVAQKHLGVCESGRYANPGVLNCSHCTKCVRTMLAIDVLGGDTSKWTAFDWSKHEASLISRRFIASRGEMNMLKQIEARAIENGRTDIAGALRTAFKRSTLLLPLKGIERLLRRHVPGLARHRSRLAAWRDRMLQRLGFSV